MTQQQTEITQSKHAIDMYREQIDKAAYEYVGQWIQSVRHAHLVDFIAGAEFALQLRQQEIDELVYTLCGLLHLHNCEQEGIGSGKPTATMWYIAVTEAEKVLMQYERR